MANTQVSTVRTTAARNEEVGARGVAIVMFCVLLVSYVLMAADRYLFPVLAPDIRATFRFSLANTGLLSTIFTLGLGLGGLPTGYLLSHFSRKTVLLTGIAIFSGATTLTTAATGFWTMLACLAAQGIGMSMLATSMFALAASYFARYRAAAIGSVNFCYGIGGFVGPLLAGTLLSETQRAAEARAEAGGAATLLNRNSVLLTVLSLIHGLSMYGFLGLYPSFLRESLHYTPRAAGFVISFFGIGALLSIVGGWVGDRFPPRLVLSGSFLCVAVLGYLFFQPSESPLTREILTCLYGVVGSSLLYVNLAGYHVKALRRSLSSRGSGMFVTSLYGGAAFGGYLLGALASHGGWLRAGEIQMSLLCLVGAGIALALQPSQMSL